MTRCGRTRRAALAAGLAAVLVAGCSDGFSARGAGTHCPVRPIDEHWYLTLHDMLTLPHWVEVTGLADRASDDPDFARVALTGRPIRGTFPAQVEVARDTLAEARVERSFGARLLATRGDGSDHVGLLALRHNGEAHFLGNCLDRAYRPAVMAFRRILSASGDTRSEAEIVLAVVSDPGGETERTLASLTQQARSAPTPVPTPWASLAPDQRALDGAPPEVVAALEERIVAISLPASWQEARVEICPRISVGWNTCVVPQASRGTIDLPVYVERDAPLELWVTERERGFRGRRVLALRIAPETLRAERVEVVGGAVGSTEEAFRAAEAGTALRLRP